MYPQNSNNFQYITIPNPLNQLINNQGYIMPTQNQYYNMNMLQSPLGNLQAIISANNHPIQTIATMPYSQPIYPSVILPIPHMLTSSNLLPFYPPSMYMISNPSVNPFQNIPNTLNMQGISNTQLINGQFIDSVPENEIDVTNNSKEDMNSNDQNVFDKDQDDNYYFENSLDSKKEKNLTDNDSMSEIQKWLDARKKNFPTKPNIARKLEEEKIKMETGEIITPPLSKLEMKLRKKIKILSQIDNHEVFNKEKEKAFLVRNFTATPTTKSSKKVEKINQKKNAKEKHTKNENLSAKNSVIKDNNLEIEEFLRNTQNEIQTLQEQNLDDKFELELKMKLEKKRNELNAEMTAMDLLKQFHCELDKLETEEESKENPKTTVSMFNPDILKSELDNKQEKESEGSKPKTNKKHRKKKKRVNKQKSIEMEAKVTRAESINDIIESLECKKQNDDDELNKFLSESVYGTDYKYEAKSTTLLTNLLVDSIYNERNVILQALRYIVQQNFFDDNE